MGKQWKARTKKKRIEGVKKDMIACSVRDEEMVKIGMRVGKIYEKRDTDS